MTLHVSSRFVSRAADIEKKTPVTPDTLFFIGSATKAFTATLGGMLVDEGRMRWDDPVEKYLPEFRLNVAGRTISQVQRVEVNVELPPDTFTLKPSTSPSSGR